LFAQHPPEIPPGTLFLDILPAVAENFLVDNPRTREEGYAGTFQNSRGGVLFPDAGL
jgi:hypothetical protein